LTVALLSKLLASPDTIMLLAAAVAVAFTTETTLLWTLAIRSFVRTLSFSFFGVQNDTCGDSKNNADVENAYLRIIHFYKACQNMAYGKHLAYLTLRM
jgi:hypothetical protein